MQYIIAIAAWIFALQTPPSLASEPAMLSAQPRQAVENTGKRSEMAALADFDMDAAVNATVTAMGGAARAYYLPEKPENAKALKRYNKFVKNIASGRTDFIRELAEVSGELAMAAAEISRSGQVSTGEPLETASAAPDYEEGVSKVTVSEGKIKVVDTNTMPCINAAGKALADNVRGQYFPDSSSQESKRKAFGRKFGEILSADRPFNRELSKVCVKLVHTAKQEAEKSTAGK